MQTSVVTYKKVRSDSDCVRIDAEFFKKEYLSIDSLLRKSSHKNLIDFGIKIYHPNEIKRNYVDSGGVLFLRAQNVRPLEIDLDSNKVYVSDEDAKKLSRNQIKYTDVLITRTGANFGQCAIYLEKEKPIASSHTFIVRTKDLNPFFLSVFLNTKYGRKLIDKGMYGASQPEIAPFYLYRIPAPIFNNDFYCLIENIYKTSFDFVSQAKNLYLKAEQILLSELGLLNWKPKHRLSFVRNFSDTKFADRIDAEYFQPMYDEVIEKVKQYKNGWSRLDDQFSQNRKSFHKINDHNYHYVEISCVRTSDGSIEPLVLSGRDLPANAKIKLQKNDIIISKVRPYRGAISIIQTDNLVGSSAFTVVQEKGTLFKETLFVLLRTKAYLKYSLKFNTGTSYPTIDDQDILGFPVPLIANAVQVSIKHKIEEALRTKHQSQYLLDIAKRGVELAIEENEQSAEKWIKRELDKLDVET